jgi:pimeloyl-ACP methyl ester carboxylesterase
MIMSNRFESLAVADQITCPTLVLHGASDTMIGPHHGQALSQAIKGAVNVTVAGMGHNDRLLRDIRAMKALQSLIP